MAGLIHHLVPFALTRLMLCRKKHSGLTWVATLRLLWSLPIYAAWYALVWWALARWSQTWVAWLWVALMPAAGIMAWHYCRRTAETARLWWQEVRMLFHSEELRRFRSEQAGLREKLLALAEGYRALPKAESHSG
jgi:hypothetical protein